MIGKGVTVYSDFDILWGIGDLIRFAGDFKVLIEA